MLLVLVLVLVLACADLGSSESARSVFSPEVPPSHLPLSEGKEHVPHSRIHSEEDASGFLDGGETQGTKATRRLQQFPFNSVTGDDRASGNETTAGWRYASCTKIILLLPCDARQPMHNLLLVYRMAAKPVCCCIHMCVE